MKMYILLFVMCLLFYTYGVMETDQNTPKIIYQSNSNNLNNPMIEITKQVVYPQTPIKYNVESNQKYENNGEYNSYTSYETYNPKESYVDQQYKILKQNLEEY